MTTTTRHPADRVYVDASESKLRKLIADDDANAIDELVTRILSRDGGLLHTTGTLYRYPEAVRVRALDLFVGKRVEVDTGSRYDTDAPPVLTTGKLLTVVIGNASSAGAVLELDPELNRRDRLILTATIRAVRQLP